MAFIRRAVFAHSHYGTEEQSNSILRLADWIVANGIEGPGDYRAARDLLLRNPPRLAGGQSLAVALTRRRWTRLPGGRGTGSFRAPHSGASGAGKTFTGARMICELVNHGKKVGITAVGHKVIRKLLDDVLKAAREMNVAGVTCAHRTRRRIRQGAVREIGTNDEALHELAGRRHKCSRRNFVALVASRSSGVPWMFSLLTRPARCRWRTFSPVRRLEEASFCWATRSSWSNRKREAIRKARIFQRLLICSTAGGRSVKDRASFLPKPGGFIRRSAASHRSCFTKDGSSRLRALSGRTSTPRRRSPARVCGLCLSVHEGNQSYSVEEVERVAGIVEYLTQDGIRWTDRHGDRRPLTLDDILIVAPYNDQVNRLRDRLPGAKVGTVDKFQGQEAAVVIYAMTTSSPEDAPRGMEFLYNLNRFNVATSRAHCACILVGSPRLFSPECRTPRQMELANVLCRYAEMSDAVSFGVQSAMGDAH